MQSLPGQKSLYPERMYAEFSEDRLYRYSLRRVWRPGDSLVNFVMLNPSVADETNNDHTVTRCINFAESWGCGGLIVTNLFGLRSTDPKMLKCLDDPVGPDNNNYISKYALECSVVVCAWGAGGSHLNRDQVVIDLLFKLGINLYYLVLTKSGSPGHPLRLNSNLKPQLWRSGKTDVDNENV